MSTGEMGAQATSALGEDCGCGAGIETQGHLIDGGGFQLYEKVDLL